LSDEAKQEENQEQKRHGLLQALREFMYGMVSYDPTREAMRARAQMEHLLMLVTVGDLLGVPIVSPYYSLRLLPYVMPQIPGWKRRMLREKDLTESLEQASLG